MTAGNVRHIRGWFAVTSLFALSFGSPTFVHAQLVVDSAGKVGIGTSTPSVNLDVKGFALVEGSGGTNNVLEVKHTGNAAKTRYTTSLGTWVIGNHSNEKFRMTMVSGAATAAMELDDAGNLVIAAEMTATKYNVPSSRTLKKDIVPVDDKLILKQLLKMPVFEWKYTTDNSGERHLGPMAEDFRDAFGLGTGATLSLGEVHGVSLAAIRGLSDVVDEERDRLETLVRTKDAEISALRESNSRLEGRVAAIEERLKSTP